MGGGGRELVRKVRGEEEIAVRERDRGGREDCSAH